MLPGGHDPTSDYINANYISGCVMLLPSCPRGVAPLPFSKGLESYSPYAEDDVI